MNIIATKVILIFISIFNYCNCNFDTVINIYIYLRSTDLNDIQT